MSLSPGRHLGHYEVLAPLGAGGMGEVYRAKDTKLGREVAIKILPEEFSQDGERRSRFEREARLLASLNHPHIATLHGLEEDGKSHFLVMELVPGETLAERLARGPLEMDEALPLFQQIAEALAAAHQSGIIHRDLKPANIKITPEGEIKVLDFGLAKALGDEGDSQELSQSPTASYGATRDGVILGTAPYMSAEQARGKRVDKETDIWAFGCVLFEALNGMKAFSGESVTDTLAAIVRSEPAWSRLPQKTPWRAAKSQLSSKLRSASAIRVFRPTAAGSSTCPMNRGATRCSYDLFQPETASGRSRATAARSRGGRRAGGRFSTEVNER